MQDAKLTREKREQQLRQMLNRPDGKGEVERLFLNCFPPGKAPPIGSLLIETILDHEYGPPKSFVTKG